MILIQYPLKNVEVSSLRVMHALMTMTMAVSQRCADTCQLDGILPTMDTFHAARSKSAHSSLFLRPNIHAVLVDIPNEPRFLFFPRNRGKLENLMSGLPTATENPGRL